jgi:DMSO/TMAO reductase YedYZ molybdopterin-dependent catalytic subunit
LLTDTAMFLPGLQGVPNAVTYDRCLMITGAGERELALGYEDCLLFPKEHQVQDVSAIVRNRRGRALWMRGLLDGLPRAPKTQHVIVSTVDGSLEQAVTLPLAEVREHGLLVYSWDGKPLSYWHGGPFHLILTDRPYGSADYPHLFRLELAEAPSIVQPRAPEPVRRAETGTDGSFYQVTSVDSDLRNAVLL